MLALTFIVVDRTEIFRLNLSMRKNFKFNSNTTNATMTFTPSFNSTTYWKLTNLERSSCISSIADFRKTSRAKYKERAVTDRDVMVMSKMFQTFFQNAFRSFQSLLLSRNIHLNSKKAKMTSHAIRDVEKFPMYLNTLMVWTLTKVSPPPVGKSSNNNVTTQRRLTFTL